MTNGFRFHKDSTIIETEIRLNRTGRGTTVFNEHTVSTSPNKEVLKICVNTFKGTELCNECLESFT